MLQNLAWEIVVYTVTFLVIFLLVLQDIWNKVMKHQCPYKSALVLQTSYCDPKYLAIDLVFKHQFWERWIIFSDARKVLSIHKKLIHIIRKFSCLPCNWIYFFQNYFLSYAYHTKLLKELEKFNLYQS